MERKSFENIDLTDTNLNVNLISETENKKKSLKKKSIIPISESTALNQDLAAKPKLIEHSDLSPDCTKGTNSISSSILEKVLKHDLQTYYRDHLEERKFLFRRISDDNIMKWSNKEISFPLTKINNEEYRGVAVQIFKNLLSYMFDRKSSKKPIKHAKKFIKLTINTPELRDEAYIQIIKQIKLHKKKENCLRGWNLFAIVASCYEPSEKLFYSILNYLINEITTNVDRELVLHANYVLIRLNRIFSYGRRKNIPSDKEIMYIEQMKPMPVPIYFFSECSVTGQIESYTTVREFKSILMKKLEFNPLRIANYSIYEVCNKSDVIEERFLEESERVCDILALWDRDLENALEKKEQIEFKFYMKLQIFYNLSDQDSDSIDIIYYQTVYDVITGKYNLNEEQILSLASLQLLSEFSSSKESANRAIQNNLEKYIPNNKINLNPPIYWQQKIMEIYSSFSVASTVDIKLNYMEILKTHHLWQSHQFDATYSEKNTENNENFPNKLVLGIRPDGITVCNSDREQLKFFSYDSIANWGISNSLFVITVSENEGNVIKYYFECKLTKIIQWVVECYTSLLAGKAMKELEGLINNYDKRYGSSGRERTGTSYSKNKK